MILNENLFKKRKNLPLPENNSKYFCCLCGVGKKENLYSRQFISYYLNLGVEKFVFGDNNDPNTEKLSDVLQDYISNGTVDIIDIIGSSIGQSVFYGQLYQKYNESCEWLFFIDFDEYLVIHFEDGKNLVLKDFLPNKIFEKCEAIAFNWLEYSDNNLSHYDNRTLLERFNESKPEYRANVYIKPIIRGNLSKIPFVDKKTHHRPVPEVKVCDSTGNLYTYYSDNYPPNYKYGYLKHFSMKSTEEFINKFLKGINGGHKFNMDDLDKKIDEYFGLNKFSEEKLKVFENYFNRTFARYHK